MSDDPWGGVRDPTPEESQRILDGIRSIAAQVRTIGGLRLLYSQVKSGYWPILDEDRDTALSEISKKAVEIKRKEDDEEDPKDSEA